MESKHEVETRREAPPAPRERTSAPAVLVTACLVVDVGAGYPVAGARQHHGVSSGSQETRYSRRIR